MVVDELISRHRFGAPQLRYHGAFWKGTLQGESLLLFKPMTYMNLSGKAVGELMGYLRLPLERLLVIFDDVALPFGTLRLRQKGSAGGHNGMASVLGALKTLDVPRLRMGVGPLPPGANLVSYVTERFRPDESKMLPSFILKGADAVELLIEKGFEKAMSVVNAPSPQ
jgi:PTH1 family peptidyl-tRNA hydrolase